MIHICSQFWKEATEVCSQPTKATQNETTSIWLVPPACTGGDRGCRHRAHQVRLQQYCLLRVGPFLFPVPSDKEATLNGAVLWIQEGTPFLAHFSFLFVATWHVLINVSSEQKLVVQHIHPYSPAPCCLPTRTSAPAMQPMPRMHTTIPMKCTALYRTSKKNQESSITTGMTKQSRSCQERDEK